MLSPVDRRERRLRPSLQTRCKLAKLRCSLGRKRLSCSFERRGKLSIGKNAASLQVIDERDECHRERPIVEQTEVP